MRSVQQGTGKAAEIGKKHAASPGLFSAPAAIALVIAVLAGAALLAEGLMRHADAVEIQDSAAGGAPDRSPAAAPSGTPQGRPDDLLTRRLKAALAESEARLGGLEPWQKKIFEEEVLPQYQRFIRDYRSAQTHSGTANSNLVVDIEMEALKNYLRFYGPKVSGAEPVMLVYLRTGDDCGPKCVAAGPGLRKLVAARIARRGFKAAWLAPEELGAAPGAGEVAGKRLHDRLAGLVQARHAAGAFAVQWGKAEAEDEAHADESHYVLRTWLAVRGLAGGPEFRNEGRMELFENDSFENSFSRLATDAFTELGARTLVAEKAAGRGSDDVAEPAEVLVSVSGFRDFAGFARARGALQGRFPAASVQERRVARGHASFALVDLSGAEASPDAVRKAVAEIRRTAGPEGLPEMEVE